MTTMSEGLRVIIAARLSQKKKKDDGGYRNGLGLETQDEQSRPWAEAQGYIVVDTVPDTAKGTLPMFKRKNLSKWVSDPAKLALYDAIVAYKNDRLSRAGWRDESEIRRWAEDNGKRLIIVNGPQWPPRHDGDRWQWEAQSIQARKEWEEDQERSDRTQRAIMDAGGFVGSPPWGYVTTGEEYAKKLVVDADGTARRCMPEAFRMTWQDKASGGSVARWLAGQTGEDWHAASIIAMLRNRTYAGHAIRSLPARWGRPAQTWDIGCEPLVDSETWERANRELDRRSEKAAAGRGTGGRSATLLGGVARCPRCAVRNVDSPMYKIKSSGRVKLNYRCSGRKGVNEKKGCGNMVPAAACESLIDQFMSGNQAEILTVTKTDPTDYDVMVRDAKNRRKALDDDAPDYDSRYEQATAEVKRLEAIRDAHASEQPVTETVGTGQSYASKWAELDETGRGAWLRRSGVVAYFVRDWPDIAGAVLGGSGQEWAKILQPGDGSDHVRVSGDPGWAKVLRDSETGVAMLVVWNPDF
jgi:DNA invertase Pin-like site-specific DNA recombinase